MQIVAGREFCKFVTVPGHGGLTSCSRAFLDLVPLVDEVGNNRGLVAIVKISGNDQSIDTRR